MQRRSSSRAVPTQSGPEPATPTGRRTPRRTGRAKPHSSSPPAAKQADHSRCGSTHGPHPSSGGRSRARTHGHATGEKDESPEHVATDRCHQVHLTAPSNAYAERFVRSIKSECLSRLVILGERHLRRAIAEYVEHYLHERTHQGIGQSAARGRSRTTSSGHGANNWRKCAAWKWCSP